MVKKKRKFGLSVLMVAFTLNVGLVSPSAQAGELYTDFPTTIKAQEKYVFYSHGFIVEGTNPTPTHPRYGVYQFPAIKAALSASGFNLIAYHRPSKTDANNFAQKLADDVHRLMAAGVVPENITLLGFSRGGVITAFANNVLQNKKINTILMASCMGWVKNRPEVTLAGRVLSLYETTDRVGSCKAAIDRSEKVTSFTEIAITTGKDHGAFFTPMAEWVTPVLKWIAKE